LVKVDEILRHLPPGAKVLDLGSGRGSFPARDLLAIRTDRRRPPDIESGEFVQAHAAQLPFRAGSFQAVICSHSLEHFDELASVLAEIGRVVDRDGCLFVSVPDASTLTDRLYRWLFQGGEHVNAFTSAPAVAQMISESTGLPLAATLVLHSSLSFLQRSRFHPRPPRRMWLIGNGNLRCLAAITFVLRMVDKIFSTRSTMYGWGFYFGRLRSSVEIREWKNVCVGCGTGYPENYLIVNAKVRRTFVFLRCYNCPLCGVWNLLTHD
jgi:SAM-dependent methyltransferase